MFLHVHALPTFETWPVASWQASLIANFYVSNIFGKRKQKTKSALFTERTRRDAHYLRAFLHSPPHPSLTRVATSSAGLQLTRDWHVIRLNTSSSYGVYSRSRVSDKSLGAHSVWEYARKRLSFSQPHFRLSSFRLHTRAEWAPHEISRMWGTDKN